MKTKTEMKLLNAILHKMCKENDVDISNVYISSFGYIQTVDMNKKDVDFCKTEFCGKKYEVKYVSGCFYPYILETV